MKKKLFLAMSLGMAVLMTACGSPNKSNETADTTVEVSTEASETESSIEGVSTNNTLDYDANDLGSMLEVMKSRTKDAQAQMEETKESAISAIGDKYDTFNENKDQVNRFYTDSYSIAKSLYEDIDKVALDYYYCVAKGGVSDYDVWNKAMDDFYDEWDDAYDDFYKEWDDSYDDVYDEWDDIISDADIDYSESSTVWKAMYETHNDSWSSLYKLHSDSWSNLYKKHQGVWSGFYKDNTDVDAILAEVQKEIEASAKESSESTETDATDGSSKTDNFIKDSADSKESTEEDSKEEKKDDKKDDKKADSSSELVDGMRPEFKEAMDSYEAFYDEYCEFMKKYKENSSDLTLLTQYATLIEKEAEMSKKFEAWDEDEMNNTELKYYLDVNNRVTKKLLDVAY